MKTVLLSLLLTTAAFGQKALPRVYFGFPSVGIGLAGTSQEIQSGGLAVMGTVVIELRNKWCLIPEADVVGFRSPLFPTKQGLVISDYPRYTHAAYGIRLARIIGSASTPIQLRPSVGVDFLNIDEPYVSGGGWFGKTYSYNTFRTVAIPVQLDLVFPFSLPNRTAIVLSSRWSISDRRSFGMVCVGLQSDFLRGNKR
jgi:hypothetical protein